MSLENRIRQTAYELGADLVGFGSIDRCEHAPLMMSPQGLMPTAKSVVVLALHHPDACIELGGETHPQEIGPYTVQYLMNSRLDEMSYRMASVIERLGYGAIPIVSSNIWRYNEYKDLNAVFAPDVSHIYMAVVAGLAEIGYSGLAITPEYGARNRFVTIVTDAELTPDPLIEPGTVCDGCMLCRKHCPSHALSVEIDGENVLKIGPYEYRFPKKNLWRCAWGEHFDLDLDLDIPEKVDEQVILENVAKYGLRGGEMGQCLKFCLPKNLRSFDREYSRTPIRIYTDADSDHRGKLDRVLAKPMTRGIDEMHVFSADDLKAKGIDLQQYMPRAASAVMMLVNAEPEDKASSFDGGAIYQVDSLCYDLIRDLEGLGCRSYMTLFRDSVAPAIGENITRAILDAMPELNDGRRVIANTVVTQKAIPSQVRKSAAQVKLDAGNATADVTADLTALATSLGVDLSGVASAARIDELAGQLKPIFESEPLLDANDLSTQFTPWKPEISENVRPVKTAGDWLNGATSVFVFGLRYHSKVLERATKPPAEAVGPYSYETYVTNWLGCQIGYQLVQRLRHLGYRALLTTDLTHTASTTASPRGEQPSITGNRFAGVAAGLGWLTTSGHLCTPQFGLRQRCMAIVTDAPLQASDLLQPTAEQNVCATCDEPCIAACPSQAFTGQRVELTCGGHSYSFVRTDPRKCDWSRRYALMGKSGFAYLGSPADVAPPQPITAEALADALGKHDPIKKYRPVVAEPCVIDCPLKA